jgi:hypothetical protein
VKPLVEPWLRRTLRALVVVVAMLVALNAAGRWRYWEFVAPGAGFPVSAIERHVARLALLSGLAALVGAAGLFDLLGSLPRVRRLAWILFALAALLAAIPALAGS